MKLTASKLRDREIGDDRLLYIPLSFLLPTVILLFALMALGVVPFGEHSLLISDGQFAPNGIAYFNRLLRGQENALYSLKNGLGYNEWGVLSWGGLSLAGLLSWFATLETAPVCFTWMVVVSMALCGLTMYLLLDAINEHQLSNLLFSTSYALMGFNVAYCFHSGFFAGPQFLPLMALGLWKIRQKKSPLLYILSLGLCIFLNFYFGFMLCAASVALLCAFLFADAEASKKEKRNLAGRWLLSSLIAGLLAAPMWLPALKAFTGGGRIDQALMFDTTFYENMPFIQIFSKLFSGANSQAQEYDGLPNIFCGILAVALVILYFMNKEIPSRRRRAAGVVLGLYLLTFFLSALTKLMHGWTHTNWFNYRYSFVFSFFLLGIAAEEFPYIGGLTPGEAKKCGAALLVSTILVLSTNYEFIVGGAVVLDLLLLALMWLFVRLRQKKPQKITQKGLAGLLLLAVSLNLLVNFTLSIRPLRDWERDLTLYKANVLFSGSSIDAMKTYDTGFFRMEKDVSESESLGVDALFYGYNGVSYSGPAVRMFYHKQLNKLGINWYDMRHWYQAGAPAATDALLGLKYILSSRAEIGEEKDYPRIVATTENAVYQNPNALGVAALVNREAMDTELGSNVFENLNGVWKAMTGGEKDVFTLQEDAEFTLHSATDSMSVTGGEILSRLASPEEGTTENGDEAYIEIRFAAERTGPVYRCDTSIPESVWGEDRVTMKYCGYFREGETVIDTSETNSAYVPKSQFLDYCSHLVYAYADNAVLAEYARELNRREISFNVVKDTDLTGAFTAQPGQRVLFTIPWDEGWSCYIDGQQVQIDKAWDLFMSVEAPEGTHTYEMKFFPAWLNYGLILCAAALLGLIVFLLLWAKKNRRMKPAATEGEPAGVAEPEEIDAPEASASPEEGTAPEARVEAETEE